MTFYPAPAISMMIPVDLDPAGMRMRWGFIGAWDPDEPVAIPAVVPSMPFPVGMLVGTRRNHLPQGGGSQCERLLERWRDPDQEYSTGGQGKQFIHVDSVFLRVLRTECHLFGVQRCVGT
jgi:hypothetical protein